MIFLLSADPYRGGNIILSGGQTGNVDEGQISEDSVPNYNKQSPTRYAYLTVIDSHTGDNLWSDQRRWGGLLTGFNSVGERLIKELKTKPGNNLPEVRFAREISQFFEIRSTDYVVACVNTSAGHIGC